MENNSSWITEEFLKEQVIAVAKFRRELQEILLFEGQEAYEKRLKELTKKPTTMKEKYMIVQHCRRINEDDLGYQLKFGMEIEEKNFETSELAIAKKNTFNHPEEYIVMPYYE